MNVYGNLPQQAPYMYGYNVPQYQRQVMPQQTDQSTSMITQQQSYVPQLMTSQFNYIKGRPVVSIDEARASQIDLDGSLYVFPDLGNKKIYTKQINMDGTAAFNVFELVSGTDSAPAPVYVTKDELDVILTQFKEALLSVKAPEPAPAPPKTQVTKTFNL